MFIQYPKISDAIQTDAVPTRKAVPRPSAKAGKAGVIQVKFPPVVVQVPEKLVVEIYCSSSWSRAERHEKLRETILDHSN
jgi:hypothetical protein